MDESDKENTLEPTDDSEPSSEGNEQGQEYSENLSSESMSTVLASEYSGQETENPQSNDQDREEVVQNELDKEVEKELEKGVEAINKYLEEEAEFINAYQEMLGSFEAEQFYERMTEEEANSNDKSSENSEELENKEVGEQEKEIPELNAVGESTGQMETDSELGEEFNEVEQHQVEPLIEEALETEAEPIINEEELEKLQELELGKQFEYIHLNEYIEELVEKQEKEYKELEKELEEKEKEDTRPSELKEAEIDREFREEVNEVEQHQVEEAIEQELETEAEPIIEEEKLEHIKNLELEKQVGAELLYELIKELAEKQNEKTEEQEEKEEHEELTKEEKIAEVMRELGINQEINHSETEIEISNQEIESEQEKTSLDKEEEEQSEVGEKIDTLQDLEEILEQNSIIEQEALVEIEQEEEKSDKNAKDKYESAKKLYAQQTGKRPIYAKKETKGFKQWLEQKKELEETQKEVEKKKQKKEETWKWSIKNWIVRALEISPELRSALLKLVEEYDELEKLVEKYAQLRNNAELEKLSQAEKDELKSLIKVLQKIDLLKIELFFSIREIKHYLEVQYYNYDFWDKLYVNRVRHHFFSRLSQKYEKLKESQENWKKLLKNWIYNTTEEDVEPKIKAELEEIIENYEDLEKIVQSFMQMYSNVQIKKLSKTEQEEFKSITAKLQKLNPLVIHLFTIVRAIKNYLDSSSNRMHNPYLHKILTRFFFKFSKAPSKKSTIGILDNFKFEKKKAIETITILELYAMIKRALETIVPSEMLALGSLSEKMLSKLLAKSENHINYIKSQIRKCESEGKVYLLTLDLLNHYKESLKSKFDENSIEVINIIDMYSKLNTLRKSSKRIHSHHPDLILKYFRIINTLEKAYWLGFLFADGFIEANGKRVVIELGKKEKHLLYRFAECLKFNKEYISYIKEHDSFILRFQSEEFCNYLINLGMIPGKSKSKNIQLPKLDSRELYLAFLLGYFDGDGIQGTSRITSGSINFLNQVRSKFNLKFNIDKSNMRLTLGAKLFNEMLDNYKNSLMRKRIYLKVNVMVKVISNSGIQIGGVYYSIERLKKLLWEVPLYKLTKIISEETGVEISDRTLAKYCDELNLNRPNSGYWHQKRFLGKFN